MMPDDDPGVQYAKRAMGCTADWVARIFRIILILALVAGVLFSILTLVDCGFIQKTSTNTSLGLFRITVDGKCIVFDSNRGITTETLGLSASVMKLARLGGVVGLMMGSFALFLVMIEFLFCRFWCSRVIIVTLLFFAALFQSLTFAIFATKQCSANKVYVCIMDDGGTYSLIAVGMFLLTSLITCPTPKAIPLCQVMREMEKNSVVDSCCCFQGRTREEIMENNDELVQLLEAAPELVQKDGFEYKQYYDSKAGVTLQDQLTAAFSRWTAAEREYSQTLDRFKQECDAILDEEPDWANVNYYDANDPLRDDQQYQIEEVGTITTKDESCNAVTWRQIKKWSPEDIPDDDLRFLVIALQTQRARADKSLEEMKRIREELESTMPQSIMIETTTTDDDDDDDEIQSQEDTKRTWFGWMVFWKRKKPVVDGGGDDEEKQGKDEGQQHQQEESSLRKRKSVEKDDIA